MSIWTSNTRDTCHVGEIRKGGHVTHRRRFALPILAAPAHVSLLQMKSASVMIILLDRRKQEE